VNWTNVYMTFLTQTQFWN